MVYKLIYFPVRGRGEVIRYICHDNHVELQEQVVTGETWPALKPSTPFGQLPTFHDGSVEIAQSNAIIRYLARKHGLYGKDDREATLIDMLNDQQEDIRLAYVKLIYQEYDAGKEAYVTAIPDKFASLEKMLGKNDGGKGFFVGDKISFVDFTMFDLLENHLTLAPHCLDTLPLLKAFHGRIAVRDAIAKYRATDEFKKRPINGNGKQ